MDLAPSRDSVRPFLPTFEPHRQIWPYRRALRVLHPSALAGTQRVVLGGKYECEVILLHSTQSQIACKPRTPRTPRLSFDLPVHGQSLLSKRGEFSIDTVLRQAKRSRYSMTLVHGSTNLYLAAWTPACGRAGSLQE